MLRKSFILIGFLPFFCLLLHGQKTQFELLTPKDGLAGFRISDVIQDEQGFLWVVCDEQLQRFDGQRFQTYSSAVDDGDKILGLRNYQDSLLFILTPERAVVLNPANGERSSYEVPVETTDSVKLSLLNQADIILKVEEGGQCQSFWQFEDQRFQQQLNIDTAGQSYSLVRFSREGKAFLFHDAGISVLDKAGERERDIPWPTACSSCQVSDAHFNQENELVLLADDHFYYLPKGTSELAFLPGLTARELNGQGLQHFILSEEGSVWAVGVVGNTFVYFDAISGTVYDFHEELQRELPAAFYFEGFEGVFRDRSGVIWAQSNLGLVKFSFPAYPFELYFSGPSKLNAFPSLSEGSTGRVYLTFKTGLAFIEPAAKEEKGPFALRSLPKEHWLPKDTLWQWNGTYVDIGTGRLRDIAGSSTYVEGQRFVGLYDQDPAGRRWRVFNDALFLLERKGARPSWQFQASLPIIYNPDDPYYLHAGQSSGLIWIACKGQLLAFSPATKQLSRYFPEELSIPFEVINVVEEDAKGRLWLGTDIGLFQLDTDLGLISQYARMEGLPDNHIFDLLPEGDSCLWLSTRNGLSRFHIERQSFINFFEGLPNNEFNPLSSLHTRNGQMFFANQQGIIGFYPEQVMEVYRQQRQSSQVVLSALKYLEEPNGDLIHQLDFPDESSLNLTYKNRSITFEFTLTDYHNTEEVLYSYHLEGYDNSWSTPARFNFVRFSSIPSGKYTLRVKARNSDGIWHPDELQVAIHVRGPWWSTKTAYFAYFLLVLGVITLIYLFLRRRWKLQGQLRLQQEEAVRLQELNRFQNKFYTNITHEFRTPLTVILGMIDQLEKDPKRYMDAGFKLIRRSSNDLLKLVNQLLDLSKIENKAFQIHLEQRDIISFLTFLVGSFESYANSKNLSIKFFSSVESLVMDYDPEQIKTVMMNLLSNALKFTPAGGEISIRVAQKDQELYIELRDTGVGIPTEELSNVFNSFYQVDTPLTRQHSGSGIGLAHTRELIKTMGGQITVESAIDQGACFYITLPIQRNAPLSHEPFDQFGHEEWNGLTAQRPLLKPNEGLKREKENFPLVLLIEDNADVVTYLKLCLEDQYNLDIAYNGNFGIEKAMNEIPDIIISDVMLPGQSGLEICAALKQNERTSHIPIILLTAKASQTHKLEGLNVGADAYLFKPFHKDELLIRIEKLLELRGRLQKHYSALIWDQETEEGAGSRLTERDVELSKEKQFLQNVKKQVLAHLGEVDFGNAQLAFHLSMSESQLFRKLKALTGRSTAVYIRSIRLQEARKLMQSSSLTISEIAYEVGFSDPSYFSRVFAKEFGMPPSAMRNDLNIS